MVETKVQFKGKKYINIETFRKNGQGVSTPVWFVEKDGVLFTRTEMDSYKVRRIRRNAEVRVAPCKMDGAVLGEWMAARAEVLEDPAAVEQVRKLYQRKYGLSRLLFGFRELFFRARYAYLAIHLK
jgi:uncharacterized protein